MKARRAQWLAVGGILTAIAAGLLVAWAVSPDVDLVEPGVPAPAFAAPDLATGDTVHLSSYKGDVVLFNIWATWCGPCQQEMPAIQALHDSLSGRGLKILAVSIDDASNHAVQEWVAKRHFTFRILHDPTGATERTFQTTGYPETFVIDRHGIIVKKVIGAAEWNDAANLALFRRLLTEN